MKTGFGYKFRLLQENDFHIFCNLCGEVQCLAKTAKERDIRLANLNADEGCESCRRVLQSVATGPVLEKLLKIVDFQIVRPLREEIESLEGRLDKIDGANFLRDL